MTNEKKILWFACTGHFFTHIYELIFPALAIPLMLYFNTSLSEVLKLSFLMYLLFGVTALPWGMFADRFGKRRSLIIFFIGTGLGALLTSSATSQTQMFWYLGLIGFFASIYHPVGMGLISVGIKNRGNGLGINGASGNLGLVMAPFAAGFLNWLAGWKITYILFGSISIALGILLFFVYIDEEPIYADNTDSSNNSSHNNIHYFYMLCFIFLLVGLAYRANNVVLPSYLELKAGFLFDFFKNIDIRNLDGAKTMAATMLASLIYIISTAGQVIGGRLADKYDLRWLYLIYHALSLPFVILMGLISQQLLVVATALYVFFALGLQPIENSLIAAYTPNKWRSTGFGIKFVLTFGVGSIAVYIVSWIKEIWQLNAVYYFAGMVTFLIILFVMLLIWFSRGATCKNVQPGTG